MKPFRTLTFAAITICAVASCSSSTTSLSRLVSTSPGSSVPSISTSVTADASTDAIAIANRERVESLSLERVPSTISHRVSAKFPNIELMDQAGRKLRFYDDIIQDHPVCINMFYTRCNGSCPGTTQKMRTLRHHLKNEFGAEMRFISISLESDVDTPEELQDYIALFEIENDPSLPEWLFLTGKETEIDTLRRSLGLYELDPELDRDKTQHAAVLTFGNDRTNRWAALPVGSTMSDLSNTMTRIAGNSPRQRYASSVLLNPSHSSQWLKVDDVKKKPQCCQPISLETNSSETP